MKRASFILIAVLLVFGAALYLFMRFGGIEGVVPDVPAGDGMIRVVAAENFYGDIAAQLGGPKVQVNSILSDPAIDPHEYESNVADSAAVADADVVIKNGLQYDTWMDKLVSASPASGRTVIVAGDVATTVLPDNPHVWYGTGNIAALAQAITDAYIAKDPADAAWFETKLSLFKDSLAPITERENSIKAAYAGTPVALTETIYLYVTQAADLNVLTPVSFERAIAEGNDPSAQDVSTANRQIAERQVKVLIYNRQTATPITINLQNAAVAEHIPMVPVTELMPSGSSYQSWMTGQLDALQQALAGSAS